MTRIERYLFQATATAFLGTLGALTAVVWITQALHELDLLTAERQTLLIFLSITGLTIPSLLMIIAPIALFIAVLYTLNKLNGDSELIVMCAAGSSPAMLLRPFAGLMVLVCLLDGYLSLVAMPASFLLLRNMLAAARADFITHIVRPGQFIDLDQGFTFHYRERGPGGELLGVFMQDRRDPQKIMTYIAEAGQTVQRDDQNYLILDRGNAQRQTPDTRDAAIVTFDRYAIDLAQFSPGGNGLPLLPRERTTGELLHLNAADPYVRFQEGRFRAELHDRFASPLYALVAALVAFAALGRAQTTRQGRGAAIAGAIVAFAALRISGIAASTLVVRTPVAVPLEYAIPLVGGLLALLRTFGLPAFGPRPLFSRVPQRLPGYS